MSKDFREPQHTGPYYAHNICWASSSFMMINQAMMGKE